MVNIRKAVQNDLEQIAYVHYLSFKGHFLQKLGMKNLKYYYAEFIRKENVFLVNVDESNTISGFVMGTNIGLECRSDFIRNHKLSVLTRILFLLLIFDKSTWLRVFDYIKKKVNKKAVGVLKDDIEPSTEFNLMSICVLNETKGKGVAKELINEFEKEITLMGYKSYVLAAYKDNTRANAFYLKNKMSVYKERGNEYFYRKMLQL